MENRAIVYTKDDCTWCVRVKRLLEDNKYAVTEMPIQDGLQWLNKIAPHPVRTVPQVIMNNEYIGGFAEVEKRLKEEVLLTEYRAEDFVDIDVADR